MKKLTLYLSILACTSLGCSPLMTDPLTGNRFKNKFADRIEEGSTHLGSTYYTSWEKTADGKFVFKQYYTPDNILTDFITYSKPVQDPSLMDGPNKRWYDDGTLWWEHEYKNGERVGVWKEYHYGSGTLKSTSVYDSTEQRYLHTLYAKEGYKREVYTTKEGKRDGRFQVFDKQGRLIAEGTYKMGDVVSETVRDEEAYLARAVERPETLPSFISPNCDDLKEEELKMCSDQAMLMKIYQNVRYPTPAREVGQQGVAIASFIIEPDGTMSEPYMLRGISEPIAQECLRIVRKLDGQWRPGTQDGKAVRVQFNLPIKFRLR